MVVLVVVEVLVVEVLVVEVLVVEVLVVVVLVVVVIDVPPVIPKEAIRIWLPPITEIGGGYKELGIPKLFISKFIGGESMGRLPDSFGIGL